MLKHALMHRFRLRRMRRKKQGRGNGSVMLVPPLLVPVHLLAGCSMVPTHLGTPCSFLHLQSMHILNVLPVPGSTYIALCGIQFSLCWVRCYDVCINLGIISVSLGEYNHMNQSARQHFRPTFDYCYVHQLHATDGTAYMQTVSVSSPATWPGHFGLSSWRMVAMHDLHQVATCRSITHAYER
jgi:hypothetical protein